MNGLLSQAATSLANYINQASSIQNLPQQAQQVQSLINSLFSNILAEIPSYQSAVLAYIASAQTQLSNAVISLANGEPVSSVAGEVSNVITAMTPLQIQATSLLNTVTTSNSQLTPQFTSLANIEGTLNGQIASFQGQIGNAQGQMEAARKRYYWLLALGPFGLPGLAAALALYLAWSGEVSALQDQINSLNGQINSLQGMIGACQSLSSSAASVLAAVTGVKNTIDNLVSDFNNIQNDLQSGSNPQVLELYLKTATAELAILESDVS